MHPIPAHVLRLGACLAIAVTPPLGAQELSRDIPARVDSLFAPHNRTDSPGLAVAVVRDGRMVFAKGYGMADLEHRVAITPSTVFDVASVSKQFAGLAIAMLVDQGKIRLEDDVRRYIPELADMGRPITINHLVHHTSGLRDWPGTLGIAGWRFDDVISFDQILAMAYHQRTLNFVPGAEYTYSNTGYNLLAEVVQRVTGQRFRAWTDANFFEPLGMRRTVFRDDHTVVIPDRALGYTRGPDGRWHAVTNNLTALGSSSMMSTVEDLAKWVVNFDSMRVGGAQAMAMTRTRGVLNDGATIPYAFGLSHGEYRGEATIGHSGSWAGFATYVVHFPRQRFGVVVLANTPAVNASRAAFQLADVFLGSALGAVPATPATTPALQLPAATLDAYAGTYRLGPGWYAQVRRAETGLTVQATGEGVVPMVAHSDSVLWVPSFNASMTFRRGADGRVTHVVYRGKASPRMPDREPAPAPLASYAGEYFSDELQATYLVEQRDGALVMRHRRHGLITLARRWGEDFGGSLWFLRSVAFTRDARGRVNGLVVNADERSRDVRFVKVR